jgi:hypothetical protein
VVINLLFDMNKRNYQGPFKNIHSEVQIRTKSLCDGEESESGEKYFTDI